MRHTKKLVIDRTQGEYDELEALLAGLQPADWERLVPRPETKAPWTVKDAVAHIVFWKLHTARVFRGERRPPELRGLEVGPINELVYQQWRDRSPVDVLAWHREVHEQVMRAISDRPDEWFGRHERSEYWPGDFTSHSAAHRHKDIEAALQAA